jgi:cell division protein FtsZ
MFVLAEAETQGAIIKVVGVGGGGGNAVTHMVNSGIEGVDFVCVNTDAQALKHARVKTSIQIGSNITKGLGAGADPEIGRQAAMEDRDRIVELIEGCDMLFITAGMGGGTGTGAAPVVAQVAKELNILTVAVVTKPFEMEGAKRQALAEQGIGELGKYVDSLITIPNQKLLTVLGGDTTLLDAFKAANQVLQGAVQGIAELITRPGLINVDFADVRTVMQNGGAALMGTGIGRGENRALEAAQQAISSPLLDNVSIAGALGVLINIIGGDDLTLGETTQINDIIHDAVGDDAEIIFGAGNDPAMHGEVRVTVIATGFDRAVPETPLVRPSGASAVLSFPAGRPRPSSPQTQVPATPRAAPPRMPPAAAPGSSTEVPEMEIPTFIRRQMD